MNHGRHGVRRVRGLLVAVLAVAVGAVAAGCAGQPESTSSWQSTTDRTLGAVISGLGTARIVVVGEHRDRLFHQYSTRAVTDAIDASGKEVSSYVVGQPPDSLHAANQAVTAALHEALALLVEVRVALASPGLTASSADGLVAKIDAMKKRLDSLDKVVMKAPETVGASS